MFMEETMRAYLAGCLDCDGSFGIKRSTYHMRIRNDASVPIYSERVLFSQVKPDITLLLKRYFGGGYNIQKPATPSSKPVYKWGITDRQAVECVKAVLPYLIIKREQAEILLELRLLKESPRIRSGTFIMKNRWGFEVIMPRRIVSPKIIIAKERLFNRIKLLNDVRTNQPQLIGKGYSGEEQRG